MALIKCPECGKEVNDLLHDCSECGYPLGEEKGHIITDDGEENGSIHEQCDVLEDAVEEEDSTVRNKKKLNTVRNWLIFLGICAFIVSAVFFYKGYDVKNNYYNSDYSILNENAYVGGDAYNYIINGTYFTGYSIIASAALLSGVMLICNSVNITIKIKEEERLWH